MVEVDKDFASKGVAGAGLGLGIAGTALGLLGGNLGGILGGWNNGGCCNENMMVNRYEAAQSARIAELETEVKLRDYVDGKFNAVNAQLCQQAVINAQTVANISCMQNTINSLTALTKTVIPIGNVCPEPMPMYNSWTAPTTTTGA